MGETLGCCMPCSRDMRSGSALPYFSIRLTETGVSPSLVVPFQMPPNLPFPPCRPLSMYEPCWPTSISSMG